ncbi:MAG: hypothetical protein IJR13_04630 [Bacteroidales bacterium]|nr:hypothetical protein [Bacteroidales bacterium]
MKKTIKFFALALLAGTLMFASCGDKDNDSDKTNTEQGGGNQQDETDTIPSIIVIFNDTLADMGIYQAVIDDSQNPYLFALVAVGKDAETGAAKLPQFQVGFQFDNEAENKWQINYIQYSENAAHFAAMKTANPKNPCEYVYKTINSFQFTKFETSPVEVSFDADITMRSLYEHIVENVAEDEVSTKPLLVRVKNFRFVNGSLRDQE